MAPALNEPLSPTAKEKLNKSTVTIKTVPVTRSTRRHNSLGASLKATIPIAAIATKPTNSNRREQISRRTYTPDTAKITTRRTRTRDTVELLAKATATVTNNKQNSNKIIDTKEPMGLTAALRPTSSNSKSNKSNAQTEQATEAKSLLETTTTTTTAAAEEIAKPTTSTTSTAAASGSDSTQEILANLTINFEEAISAEICLRKQFLDSNLNKEVAKKTNGTELKDIFVIKGNVGLRTTESSEGEQQQHMEPLLQATDDTLNAIDNKLWHKNDVKCNSDLDAKNKNALQAEQIDLNASITTEQQMQQNVIDAEDHLEERLRQLDGSMADINVLNDTIETKQDNHIETLEEQLSTTATIQQHELQQLHDQLQFTSSSTRAATPLSTSTSTIAPAPAPAPASAPSSSVNEMSIEQQQSQQSFNNLNTNIIAAASELEDQDLEEVFKALKGFDPSTASAETLCDLNALFGEDYQNINYEYTNASQAAAITSATSPLKSNPLQESQQEIDKTQQVIQRKLDFLVRRLRKMQARHMCKHTSEELAGIFEYTVRAVNNKLRGSNLISMDCNDNDDTLNKPSGMSVISARPLPHVWQEERDNPVSASQAYNLLRKLETAAKAQQFSTVCTNTINSTFHQGRKSRKSSAVTDAAQSVVSTESTIPPAVLDNIVPTFDALAVEEITQVVGMLQTEMREVQQAIDSEATGSSSGCESADEMISYNNHIQQPLPIEKRAAWRYARDRAAIAARWSWLQTHIADLDIKIRQHTELYNEIVRKKGPVINDIKVVTIRDDENDNDNDNDIDNDNDNDNDNGSCRTRGCLSKQFRKRKLLQTTNIHTISKKAGRPSTIKCGCQWPMQPCALCTGRPDPTAPRELPNTMGKLERVALLDSGFHSVLSFPEDISSSICSEALARLSDWQQRAMRCQVKSIAKSIWKAEREASGFGSGINNRKYDGIKRRYIKKKDRLAAEAAATAAASGTAENAVKKDKDVDGGLGMNAIADNYGTDSTTGTTPLVANNRMKVNCQTRGNGRIRTTTIASTSMEMNLNYAERREYAGQKYNRYNNRKPTLISRKNNNSNRFHYNRNRKAFSSSSSSSSFSVSASHRQHQNNNQANNNINTINRNNNNHHRHHNHQQQLQQQQYLILNGNSSSSETANNLLHMHDNWDYVTSMCSRTASPTHIAHTQRQERSERKRNSYDIDNIVIPYSVAASTRVEIIPYKEIPTPKWRVLDTDNEEEEEEEGAAAAEQEGNLVEDEENKVNELKSCKEIKILKDENMENCKLTSEMQYDNKVEQINETISNHKTKIDTTDTDTDKVKEEPSEDNCVEEKMESQLNNKEEAQKDKNEVNESNTEESKIIENDEKVKKEITLASENEPEDPHNSSIEESCEDITDAVMALRHERALIEERRKFQTYLKFPWTTRSRANRRGDSRAESSGANTPDPTSPAILTTSIVGGDQESIPSPAPLSTPPTPFTPLDSASAPYTSHEPFSAYNNSQYRNSNRKRRRTTSSKKDQERRSQTPDNRELMFPYEPLNFPLSDEHFEDLQSLMPWERRLETKIDCNSRKPVGSFGRGRNGLRRQTTNTAAISNLTRSMRPRLSNRPYVLHRRVVAPTKETNGGDFEGFQQSIAENNNINNNNNNSDSLLFEKDKSGQMDSMNAEETEDETETCAFNELDVGIKDEQYTEEDDDDDDDDDETEDLDDEEDDGFPRHPLATADDLMPTSTNDKIMQEQEAHSNARLEDINSAYAAYVGHSDLFSDCEMESSDAEPFKDDDPNDPEWNGEQRRKRM